MGLVLLLPVVDVLLEGFGWHIRNVVVLLLSDDWDYGSPRTLPKGEGAACIRSLPVFFVLVLIVVVVGTSVPIVAGIRSARAGAGVASGGVGVAAGIASIPSATAGVGGIASVASVAVVASVASVGITAGVGITASVTVVAVVAVVTVVASAAGIASVASIGIATSVTGVGSVGVASSVTSVASVGVGSVSIVVGIGVGVSHLNGNDAAKGPRSSPVLTADKTDVILASDGPGAALVGGNGRRKRKVSGLSVLDDMTRQG